MHRIAFTITLIAAGAAAHADSFASPDRGGWNLTIGVGSDSMDFIGLTMNNEAQTFLDPIAMNYSVEGWDRFGFFGDTPSIAALSGPDTDFVQFSLFLSGSFFDDYSFDVYAFDENQALSAARHSKVGSTITVTTIPAVLPRSYFENAVIPTPATATIGVLALGTLSRRRRKAA